MLRSDVQKKTGLTRKAIDYYEQAGLIQPEIEDNGYRNFSEEDVEKLTKISILRKLGLSVSDIKDSLEDESLCLSSIIRRKSLENEFHSKKLQLLKRLEEGAGIDEIDGELKDIEVQESIFTKLTQSFPGYLGYSLFFAYEPFLRAPLEEDGIEAFNEYVQFLDQLPPLDLTLEEIEYLERESSKISNESIREISDKKFEAIGNIDTWFEENKEFIEQYEEMKSSDEYIQSEIAQITAKLSTYLQEHHYHEKAIPLIRKFSKSYDKYYRQLLQADERFQELIDRQ